MSIASISRGGRLSAAFLLTAALAACEGPEGPAGPTGPQGPPGAPGTGGGGLAPGLSTIDKAFAGLGGQAAVTGLTSFSVEAEGTRMVLSEGFDPDGGSEEASTFTNTTVHDLEAGAFRIDWDRDFLFPFPGSLAYSEVVNGDLGYVKGTDSMFVNPADPEALAALPSDRMAAIRKEQRLLNPVLLLREVAADPALASEGGLVVINDSIHEKLVIEDDVSDINLFINSNTGQILKVETMENDHLRRDVALEVFYADWQESGGVRFPGAVVLTVAGEVIHAETRTVTANGASADVAIPSGLNPAPTYVEADAERGEHNHQWLQQFVSLGIPTTGVQDQVMAVPLDNEDPAQARVFHLMGGTHHSLAVRQANGVVIVEAPLYPERSQAIMDWVETQFGAGTLISNVILTHHHFDHSAGARELLGTGATLVVHEAAVPFFEKIVARPSTLVPDLLVESGFDPNIRQVLDDTQFLLDDANAPILVYSLPSTHARDLLLVYVDLPGNGILFVTDIFSPGFPPAGTGPEEILTALSDYELSVDLIAGGHGTGTATLDVLEDFVNPPAR